jgi:hypothetical protein
MSENGILQKKKDNMPEELQVAIELYAGAYNRLHNALANAPRFWREALGDLAPVLPKLISETTPPRPGQSE